MVPEWPWASPVAGPDFDITRARVLCSHREQVWEESALG